MKRAFMSELAIVRTLVLSIAGVGLFIFVVLTAVRASNGDSDMKRRRRLRDQCHVAYHGHDVAGRARQPKRMGALSGSVAHLTQRHRQRTLPVHHYFLGHHDVRGRAVEYRRHPNL